MSDDIETPPELARSLVEFACASVNHPTLVADFAAGNGNLLQAAHEVWPRSDLVGVDVNEVALTNLRKTLAGSCRTLHVDFMSESLRPELCALEGQVEVILLNPPFSCRGGRRTKIVVGDQALSTSTPLAFFIRATRYLATAGVLVSLLPVGCLYSEKDEDGRRYLRRHGSFEVVATNHHKAFPQAVLKSVVVVFRPATENGSGEEEERQADLPQVPYLNIKRGHIAMHTISIEEKSVIPLIHTTELKNNSVLLSGRFASPRAELISGPMVLVPRVGKPSRYKIARILALEPIAVSDCIFAILCKSDAEARILYAKVQENWQTLQDAYGGSCAPYLTRRRLQEYLCKIGYAENGGRNEPRSTDWSRYRLAAR